MTPDPVVLSQPVNQPARPMHVPRAPGRAESDNDRRVREWRDAQPMVTRCAVDGCDFRVEGSALECREAAHAHRLAKHRGVVLERGVRRRKKAQRAEQTAEDRKIIAGIAARAAGGLMTPARVSEAVRRHNGGETQMAIARAVFAEWGYKTPVTCQVAISKALRSLGIKGRRGRPAAARPAVERLPAPRWGKLTSARTTACRRLYEAGISAGAISELMWQRYGYGSRESCRSAILDRLRRDGVELRANTVQIAIPELNRREAIEILEAAEATGLSKAA